RTTARRSTSPGAARRILRASPRRCGWRARLPPAATTSVAGRCPERSQLLSRPHRRALHKVGTLDGAKAPGLAHARQHARGHRDRLLVPAAAREDEEAPPRAHVRELDLLPLVLQLHLVG